MFGVWYSLYILLGIYYNGIPAYKNMNAVCGKIGQMAIVWHTSIFGCLEK